jgi:hypothetical protein
VQELQEAVAALTKENLRYVREEAAKAATNHSAPPEGRPREKNLLLAALLAAPPGPLSLSALLAAVKEVEAAGGPPSAAEADMEAAFNTLGRKHLSEEQVGCTIPQCCTRRMGLSSFHLSSPPPPPRR